MARDKEYETLINFEPRKNIVSFDRSYSSRLCNGLHKREMKVRNQKGNVKLRLIIDKYSQTMFV